MRDLVVRSEGLYEGEFFGGMVGGEGKRGKRGSNIKLLLFRIALLFRPSIDFPIAQFSNHEIPILLFPRQLRLRCCCGGKHRRTRDGARFRYLPLPSQRQFRGGV